MFHEELAAAIWSATSCTELDPFHDPNGGEAADAVLVLPSMQWIAELVRICEDITNSDSDSFRDKCLLVLDLYASAGPTGVGAAVVAWARETGEAM